MPECNEGTGAIRGFLLKAKPLAVPRSASAFAPVPDGFRAALANWPQKITDEIEAYVSFRYLGRASKPFNEGKTLVREGFSLIDEAFSFAHEGQNLISKVFPSSHEGFSFVSEGLSFARQGFSFVDEGPDLVSEG